MSLLKNKQILLKKAVSIAVSILLITGCLVSGIAVGADDISAEITFTNCYDSNGNEIKYVNDLVLNNSYVAYENQLTSKIFADDEVAFCIEPNQRVSANDRLEMDNSPVWENLTEMQKTALKIALMYGYQGNADNIPVSDGEVYVATQIIIWEIVSGLRNTLQTFDCTSDAIINSVYDSTRPEINSGVKTAYDIIDSCLENFYVMPSFTYKSEEIAVKEEMQWCEEEEFYRITLTDENNVLLEYNLYTDDDITIQIEGNELTVITANAYDNIVLNFSRKLPAEGYTGKFVLWGDSTHQDLVTGLDCNINTEEGVCVLFAKELPTEPITEPQTEEPTEPITEPQTEELTEPLTEPQTEEPTEDITEQCTQVLVCPIVSNDKTITKEITVSNNCNIQQSVSNELCSYSTATGKVSTGDSKITIIVLSLLFAMSGVTVFVMEKRRKKSNYAQ